MLAFTIGFCYVYVWAYDKLRNSVQLMLIYVTYMQLAMQSIQNECNNHLKVHHWRAAMYKRGMGL